MDKKLEFELKIRQAYRIFIAAKENFHYSRYLLYWNNEKEKKYILKSGHLRFISHSLWRTSVIETCKLAIKSNNNHFNIFELIDFIEIFLGHLVDSGKIENWRKDLTDVKEKIDHIRTVRNKIYAHTDENGGLLFPHVSFDQLNEVLEVLWRIIFQMALTISDAHFSKSLPFFDGPKLDIIEVLTEEKERRLRDKYGNRKTT